jgi:microcompartment protein CcmL/EutN
MENVTDALGLLELGSIARGYVVTDAMVKKAPVRVYESRAVTPGKYIVLVAGDVAEVDEAMRAGLAAAQGTLIDQLFLPQAHAQLAPLLRGDAPAHAIDDAMAIVETNSVASTIVSADAAAKAAAVWLVEMKLAVGIGGKGYFTLAGELPDVQAAAEAAAGLAGSWLAGREIIARPHDDLRGFLRAKGRSR